MEEESLDTVPASVRRLTRLDDLLNQLIDRATTDGYDPAVDIATQALSHLDAIRYGDDDGIFDDAQQELEF